MTSEDRTAELRSQLREIRADLEFCYGDMKQYEAAQIRPILIKVRSILDQIDHSPDPLVCRACPECGAACDGHDHPRRHAHDFHYDGPGGERHSWPIDHPPDPPPDDQQDSVIRTLWYYIGDREATREMVLGGMTQEQRDTLDKVTHRSTRYDHPPDPPPVTHTPALLLRLENQYILRLQCNCAWYADVPWGASPQQVIDAWHIHQPPPVAPVTHDRSREHHQAVVSQVNAMHMRAQLAESRAERAEKFIRRLTPIHEWFGRGNWDKQVARLEMELEMERAKNQPPDLSAKVEAVNEMLRPWMTDAERRVVAERIVARLYGEDA